MGHFVIGIDPGMKGALAIRGGNENTHEFFELPFIESELDCVTLRGVLFGLKRVIEEEKGTFMVWLEKAQAMPKNGAVSMFKYGRAFGSIEGILSAMRISYALISPKEWTKEMHRGVSDKLDAKQKSAVIAKRLFPEMDFKKNEKSKKDHDGFIDAALIAEYGLRVYRGQTKLS